MCTASAMSPTLSPVGEPGLRGMTTLIRSDGTQIELSGDWRVAED